MAKSNTEAKLESDEDPESKPDLETEPILPAVGSKSNHQQITSRQRAISCLENCCSVLFHFLSIITFQQIRCRQRAISCLENCCSILFRFLSIITFQYIHSDLSSSTKCLQIVYTIMCTVILGSVVNICPLAVFLYDWIACPMEYYDMCFIFEFHSDDSNNTKIPVIVMRSNEGKKDKIS